MSVGEMERCIEKFGTPNLVFAFEIETRLWTRLGFCSDRILPVNAVEARASGQLSLRLDNETVDILNPFGAK
jgi:hypothetical protein